ncbi:hypothetical protein BKA83DRAFT_1538592 [Pisolithus microcarpus]|nr:hypothetical protein BKA83DRAFT_1538592 [Pisolithus microcarpus]
MIMAYRNRDRSTVHTLAGSPEAAWFNERLSRKEPERILRDRYSRAGELCDRRFYAYRSSLSMKHHRETKAGNRGLRGGKYSETDKVRASTRIAYCGNRRLEEYQGNPIGSTLTLPRTRLHTAYSKQLETRICCGWHVMHHGLLDILISPMAEGATERGTMRVNSTLLIFLDKSFPSIFCGDSENGTLNVRAAE